MTEKELALILKKFIEMYKGADGSPLYSLQSVKTYEELDYRYFHEGIEIEFDTGEKFLVELIKYLR